MAATAKAANDPTVFSPNAGIYDWNMTVPGGYYVGDPPPQPQPQTNWWWFYPYYYWPPQPQPAKCPGCGRCNTCGKKEEE